MRRGSQASENIRGGPGGPSTLNKGRLRCWKGDVRPTLSLKREGQAQGLPQQSWPPGPAGHGPAAGDSAQSPGHRWRPSTDRAETVALGLEPGFRALVVGWIQRVDTLLTLFATCPHLPRLDHLGARGDLSPPQEPAPVVPRPQPAAAAKPPLLVLWSRVPCAQGHRSDACALAGMTGRPQQQDC